MYWVYMLQCGDGSLYTGITTDIPRRLRQHSSGKGGRYTRSHLPVTLRYQEGPMDKSSALRRELEIKAMPRGEKLKLILGAAAYVDGAAGGNGQKAGWGTGI